MRYGMSLTVQPDCLKGRVVCDQSQELVIVSWSQRCMAFDASLNDLAVDGTLNTTDQPTNQPIEKAL